MGPRLVLLVEDDAELRVMMEAVLTIEGVRVVTATNGAEAFNLARKHRPCLILLDLMMPIMTGEEFRKAQLANAEIRDIPVLVVSAHYDAPRTARRMKAIACLTKPIDFEALGAAVRARCGERRAH
jgi:CheY-like chemotaxis protein